MNKVLLALVAGIGIAATLPILLYILTLAFTVVVSAILIVVSAIVFVIPPLMILAMIGWLLLTIFD